LGRFPKETLGSFYNIKSKPQSKFPSMWDFFSHKIFEFKGINNIIFKNIKSDVQKVFILV